MITISDIAKEKGTFVIDVSFTDENEEAAVPTSMVWSLATTTGTIINSRDQVAVDPGDLAATVSILLSDNDLALQTGEIEKYVKRRFIVEAIYNSDLGTDLPVNGEAEFTLENLSTIT